MRLTILLLLIFSLNSFAGISIKKDISYKTTSTSKSHTLDIYYPTDITVKKGVFVFIHGGSWKNGKKETYKFLGKNMSKKGLVTVIINYRLSPEVKYDAMAEDCTQAVKWVAENISAYGGDPNKITVAGHSAGGHLAACIAFNNSFKSPGIKNPIEKIILIDAFGLDMATYFKEYNNDYSKSLLPIFGTTSNDWREASPIYSIKPEVKIPFLILNGSKTFPTIISSSKAFANKLRENNIACETHTLKGKKHIGMISQLYFKRNKTYSLLLQFMTSIKNELKTNSVKASQL